MEDTDIAETLNSSCEKTRSILVGDITTPEDIIQMSGSDFSFPETSIG
jgi:hypothetical protein